MKLHELKQIIREELSKALKEDLNKNNIPHGEGASFGDIVNNLPIDKMWVVKDPKTWKDWKQGVIECTKDIITFLDDEGRVVGIRIPHIEPYVDGDFNLDPEWDYTQNRLEDMIDGFYAFSNKKAADKFFNELMEDRD